MPALLRRWLVVLAASAPAFAVPGAGAQQVTIVERNDAVRNVIVIDDTLVTDRVAPVGASGIRVDPDVLPPETRAKEEAIENRLEGGVRADGRPALVKGRMDNIIQVEGVYAVKRSDDDKACIEIGTVGGHGDCRENE